MNAEEMRLARTRRKDAERRKRNTLAQLRGEPTGMVDSAPIRAKTKALNDLGWSLEAIAHMGGAGTSAGLRLIMAGRSRKCERKFLAVAALPLTLGVPEDVPDSCFVPSLGATRRVRALMANGWRHQDITEFIGRASHHLAAGRHPRMPALDWRIVAATYDKLSDTNGGSRRTLLRAQKAGFPPPLAWDDIDDPNETPSGWKYAPRKIQLNEDFDPVVVMRLLEGDRVPSTAAERAEALAQWVADGGSESELCRWHGWRPGRYGSLRLVGEGVA